MKFKLPETYLPIGFVKTAFTEKFGVPRQSMMISEAKGILKLNADPLYRPALNHLEQFSHVWLVFVFDRSVEKGWRPTIRPPRLDAPRRVGVFASRSPHRPNPIGLSAVKLDRIDFDAPGGIEIHLSGVDLLDGTPVLDIKPYLPYADRIDDANGGWADGEITKFLVSFSESSLQKLDTLKVENPHLQRLIEQMLEWDPRPTSQRRAMPIAADETDGKAFAFRILDVDVKWIVKERNIFVKELVQLFEKI